MKYDKKIKEKYSPKLNGKFYDEIYKKDEAGNIYLDETTKIDENTITVPVVKLLAGLLANDPSFAGGILYHVMGEGDIAWDTAFVEADSGEENMTNELVRLPPDSIVYLDENDNIVTEITNRLRIKTTLDFLTPATANGKYIREQGLSGGDATATADTGKLIDKINHERRWKDETIRIIRYIILEINNPV